MTDPVVAAFGKDVAQLIYWYVHKSKLRSINGEYLQLLHLEPHCWVEEKGADGTWAHICGERISFQDKTLRREFFRIFACPDPCVIPS